MPENAGLSAAAAAGNRLSTLEVLRDLLARQIETCESSRDVAALTARFVDVLEQIAGLAPPEQPKGTTLDELEKRRLGRGAAATGAVGAAGNGERGGGRR